MKSCKVIVIHVRDNKQFAVYIDNYQAKMCNNDFFRHQTSKIAMAVANYSSKEFYDSNKIFATTTRISAQRCSNLA